MCKFNVYYGPENYFQDEVKKINHPYTLEQYFIDFPTDLITTHKKEVDCMIIKNNHYSRLSDSGFNNLMEIILSKVEPKEIYFHNPPKNILNQFKLSANINYYNYKEINDEFIKNIYDSFDKVIIGQKLAKLKILSALYNMVHYNHQDKPYVVVLYDPPGVGKTETVKMLSEKLGEKLFRKQFSMFQSSSFHEYIFGGEHQKPSLAQELLARTSNIILFDEFDKVHGNYYNAFYQLFDEGILEDKYYCVKLKKSLIICTTNCLNKEEIEEKLGEPIFSRVNMCIEYFSISKQNLEVIINKQIDECFSKILEDDKKFITKEKVKEEVYKYIGASSNIREVRNLVNEIIFTSIVYKKYY